jgi:hypothetical protein
MEKAPDRGERAIPFSAIESGMLAGMWWRPTSGFEWRDDLRAAIENGVFVGADPEPGESWLVPKSAEARRYPVLANVRLTAAFQRVALDPTPAQILRFANQYGALTSGQWLVPRDRRSTTGSRVFTMGGSPADFGESLSFWQEEAVRFGLLYETWMTVRAATEVDAHSPSEVARARDRLSNLVHWGPDDSIRIRSELTTMAGGTSRSWTWVTHRDLPGHDEIIAGLPPHDLAAAARYHLIVKVNEQLKGRVHPYLLPFRTSTIRFVPDALLAAIYLRFAFEISEGIGRLRECLGCAQTFVPSRRDQRYCSKNCRERASYRRRTGGAATEREAGRGEIALPD